MTDGERRGPDSASEPGEDDRVEAELRTFLIADVRGYTSFTQRHGDELAAKLAGKFARVTREVVEGHQGSVLELRGDEALCVFVSPRQAVRCAVALQRRYVDETGWEAALPLPVGIGMDIGEAVPVEGGYRSGALNLAARLCSLARSGEIFATPELTHLTRRLDGMSFVGRDPVRLKGLADPIRPVRVVPEGEDPYRQLAALGALPPKPDSLVAPAWLPDRLRRPPRLLLAVPLALALIASGVVAVRVVGPGPLTGFRENVLGSVDLRSGALTGQADVGHEPSAVAAGEGAIWVVNKDDDTVSRFDPETGNVTAIDVHDAPTGLAVGGGNVWVADSASGELSRIDIATNHVTKTVPVGSGPTAVTYGDGAVWVADTTGNAVYLVDPKSGSAHVAAQVPGSPSSLVFADGRLWVTAALTGTVEVVDPRSGREIDSVHVGNDPRGIAAFGDSVWVANNLNGTVSRIPTNDPSATTSLPVGAGPVAIAGDDHDLWVASTGSRSLTHIDPDRFQVVGHIPTASQPQALAVSDGRLWVGAGSDPTIHVGGTLTAALPDYFGNLDPAHAYATGAWVVLSDTNDGLLALRKEAGAEGDMVVPDLATRLPTVSDDGLTYTFQLRTGIRWSTGEPVTAFDIRRGLERTVAQGVWPLYGGIAGASDCSRSDCDLSDAIHVYPDTGTLTITLTRPDPDFLYKLSLSGADAVPADTPFGKLKEPIPATGPYMIAAQTSTHVELARNPAFHEWSAAAQPTGYPDRIVIDSITGSDTGTEPEYSDHDWVGTAFGADLDRVLDKYGSRVHVVPEPATQYVFLRADRRPFNNVQARRAVAYALNRSALAADWIQPGDLTCQIVPPTIPDYRPYCPFTLPDPVPGEWRAPQQAKAQHLVDRSKTAGDVVRLVSPGIGAFDQIQDTLTDLGYDVHPIQFPSFKKYFQCIQDPTGCRFEAGFIGWVADFPATANFLEVQLSCRERATPGSGGNFAQYCNPRFDTAMRRAAALQVSHPAAGAARWAALEHEAVDNAALIGIVNPSDIDILSARIGHTERNPQLGVLLDQAWVH